MDFSNKLINWYNNNKRNLPWRKTKDPYTIWVSEVILQQTRVDQGLDYYYRFLERFPDVKALAEATESEVLSVWKGLGYYSRARNMHVTAKNVVDNLSGVFPSDYATLISLKGIGGYTAAAISSICANEVHAVVDGNVVRVLSRIFGYRDQVGSTQSRNKVLKKAAQLIPRDYPGDFNQAVMEFGAIHCKPSKPLCIDCIFKNDCFAFRNNLIDELPVKKRQIIKRNRYFNYLCVVIPEKGFVLGKRSEKDIWKNLWEFPLLESDKLMTKKEMQKSDLFVELSGSQISEITDYRHLLTHQVIHTRFFIIAAADIPQEFIKRKNYIIDNPLVSGLPISRLTERFLQKL